MVTRRLSGKYKQVVHKAMARSIKVSYVMCVGGMLCELLPAEVGRYSMGLL